MFGGENFPYTNFHDINMDWIIKIAKDFLDQYTHIQQIIETGEQELDDAAQEHLTALADKAEELTGLLDAWYSTHSQDIANELAAAITSFNSNATAKTLESIASIPADYTALSNQVDNLQHEVEDGYYPNPIDPALTADSAVQSSTGNFIAYNTYSRTGHVQLPENSMYVIMEWTSAPTYSMNSLCFYDENTTFISGISNPLTYSDLKKIHEIPVNAKYIAYSGSTVCFPILSVAIGIRNTMGIIREEMETKADLLKSFDVEYVKQQLPAANIWGTNKFPGNLVVIDECVDNAYINYSTGTLFPNQPDYWCTGYIPVEPGTQYKANHGRNYACYNANKVYVDGAAGTDIHDSYITTPANAAYIRFTINKAVDGITNPLDLYFAKLSQYDETFTIPGLVATPSFWCSGKRVNWLGDSIVAGYDFDDMVCEKTGMIQNNDYGINGSTIALNNQGVDGRSAMCARYSQMSDDADIIIVSGGTNDWMYAWSQFGDINSTSSNTFYGALKNLCKGLLTKYPGKTIIFTTPIHRSQAFENGNGGSYTPDGQMTTPFSKNYYGRTLKNYADAIKEVCSYYSIPVLDLYSEALLDPSIPELRQYFDEALTHPNNDGRKLMAERMCGWLIQLKVNMD